jgi:hypothetical protein
MRQLLHPNIYNTAHSKPNSKKVRIIRPHHPLYGQSFQLVRTWKNKQVKFYIIQLPDRKHIQIPIHWTDDGTTPLPENLPDYPVLTADSIRDIIYLLKLLNKKLKHDKE